MYQLPHGHTHTSQVSPHDLQHVAVEATRRIAYMEEAVKELLALRMREVQATAEGQISDVMNLVGAMQAQVDGMRAAIAKVGGTSSLHFHQLNFERCKGGSAAHVAGCKLMLFRCCSMRAQVFGSSDRRLCACQFRSGVAARTVVLWKSAAAAITHTVTAGALARSMCAFGKHGRGLAGQISHSQHQWQAQHGQKQAMLRLTDSIGTYQLQLQLQLLRVGRCVPQPDWCFMGLVSGLPPVRTISCALMLS